MTRSLTRLSVISIHAPVKGATHIRACRHGFRWDFNPRSREGSDHLVSDLQAHKDYFNPRSREGSDQDEEDVAKVRQISIHAPVKGATCCALSLRSWARNFNPRSREGSDVDARILTVLDGISIHAPVKGATDGTDGVVIQPVISIHAPVKGATRHHHIFFTSCSFQSTLP